MQTLYFIAMVAGVGWLMAWAAMPHPGGGGLWWPFDMKDDRPGEAEPEAPQAARPAADGRPVSWRERAARPGPPARPAARAPGGASGRGVPPAPRRIRT